MLGWSLDGFFSPDQADSTLASCNSAHDWLMKLVMDLTGLCDSYNLPLYKQSNFLMYTMNNIITVKPYMHTVTSII